MIAEAINRASERVAEDRNLTPQEVESLRNRSLWFGYQYRPHETRRLFIELYRCSVADAPKPLSEVHLRDLQKDIQGGKMEVILRGNVVGHVMRDMLIGPLTINIESKCRSNTDAAATQTLIALKAFQTKNGRLPQTLDELVPEFLPAVPLDDFDGKPIRYSPAKKVLYSVGEDFKDGGGMTRDEARRWWDENKKTVYGPLGDNEEPNVWDLPDPSWPIEF